MKSTTVLHHLHIYIKHHPFVTNVVYYHTFFWVCGVIIGVV